MKSIDELIADHYPYGVEYKSLGELGDFYGGLTGKCKDDFADGNAKFISYMNVYSNPATNLKVSDTVKVAENEKQNQIQLGDVLFTGSSETPEECAMSSIVTTDVAEPTYLNSFCFGLRLFDGSLYLPDFLKHLLRGEETRKQLHKTASGVTRFNVSKEKMTRVTIPLPPLAVQKEIVRILDGFTGLIDELEAELAARRKQYEQYRDKLLTFGDEVERKPLGEMCNAVTPSFKIKRQDYQATGTTPIISQEEEFISGYCNFSDSKVSNGDYICFGDHSEHIKYVDFAFVQGADGLKILTVNNKNIALTKFVYYCAQKLYRRHNNYERHFKYFEDTLLPIPPLAEQKRIVAVLDKFEALRNDETAGLAAEITARKKQYEYYRDKLLTFKRKESA